MQIKKGDRVLVISGKDKGVTGKVIEAHPRTGRLLVEGVNRITRHVKPGATAQGSRTGGIVVQEAPIHASKVMLAVEHEGRTVGTRVGYRFDEQGNKVRYAKRTGEDI